MFKKIFRKVKNKLNMFIHQKKKNKAKEKETTKN